MKRESGAGRIFWYNWPVYVGTWAGAGLLLLARATFPAAAVLLALVAGGAIVWSLASLAAGEARGQLVVGPVRCDLRRRAVAPARGGESLTMTALHFDFHSHLFWLRLGIALVWLLFGLFFKTLGAVPRHRQIVARVVGESAAGAVTQLVAVAEIGLGLWMASGRRLVPCVAAQTLLILAMNACELRYARDLLLSPVAMVCANILFLILGWYVALG